MTIHATDIVAYTYEADYHCIACTIKHFQHSLCIHYMQGKPCNNCRDSNDVLEEQKDDEGNLVHPVFVSDEWQHLQEEYLEEYPTQYLACGDCHEVIEEYTHQGE